MDYPAPIPIDHAASYLRSARDLIDTSTSIADVDPDIANLMMHTAVAMLTRAERLDFSVAVDHIDAPVEQLIARGAAT